MQCDLKSLLSFLYMSSYIAGRRYLNSITLKLGLNYTCGVLRSFNYDDYVTVSPADRATALEEAFAMLLDLLGWRYDKDVSKSDSMSEQVSSVGV